MRLSRRTLVRRLGRVGTSFRQLFEAHHRERARALAEAHRQIRLGAEARHRLGQRAGVDTADVVAGLTSHLAPIDQLAAAAVGRRKAAPRRKRR